MDTSGFADVRGLLAEGEVAAALDELETLLPATLVSEDHEAASALLLLLGQARAANGEPDRALVAFERAQLFADQTAQPRAQARAYRALGEALMAADRFTEAAVHFDAAARFYGRAGAPGPRATLLRAESRAHLLAGQGEPARRAALESAEVAAEAGLRNARAEGLRLAAATAASLEDYGEAYRTLRRAEALQTADLEAALLAQRTDLEQSLLAALAIREAERIRSAEALEDALEEERVRWHRRLALVIGALALGVVGGALLIWGATVWPRRFRRARTKDVPTPAPEESRPSERPASVPPGSDAPARRVAAMAPNPLDGPRGQPPGASPDADTEETGLALAAFLLDQQLRGLVFAGDGVAAPDRSRLQGRAETLRLLRHRVACQGVEVDMQGYLDAIADYMRLRRGSRVADVAVVVEAHARVRVRQAAPLGLVAHELIANALDYAFQGRRAGTVHVRLVRHARALTLRVADDGRGLPADFSLERSGGEGVAFVRALAAFLRAAVEVRNGDGAQWTLSVPLGTDKVLNV